MLLNIGVFVFTPILGMVFEILSAPLPLFIALGFVLALYGLYCIAIESILQGLAVSLLVLMTTAANVPLSTDIVGGIGPQIWLYQIPLVGIFAIYALRTWSRNHVLVAHLLLGSFAVWTVVSLPFIAGPRVDMAVWFAVYAIQFTLIFVLVSRLILDGILSRRSTIGVLGITVVWHVLLGMAQIINKGPFGISHLGESTRVVDSISFGLLGAYQTGPYVSGLAGGAAFASLCVMICPILITYAYQSNGLERSTSLLMILFLIITVRFTAWDASRGGLIVGIGVLGCIWLANQVGFLEGKNPSKLAVRLFGVLGSLLAFTSVLIGKLRRSSRGKLWFEPIPKRSDQYALSYLSPGDAVDFVKTIHIPGFDASNLAIRIWMYVIGLDLFLQHPIFGIGGVNFAYIAEGYGFNDPHEMHNIFVMLLAETGFPGFLLYSAALCGVLVTSWRRFNQTGDILIIGAVAGLIGYIATLNLRSGFVRTPAIFTFWALAGALVAPKLDE